MRMKSWATKLMALLAVILGFCTFMGSAAPQTGSAAQGQLVISRAKYLDRAQAIWTGQMIGQWTGWFFEHKVASVLNPTPFHPSKGYAPIDDDYYYEMVAIRAFEKYGIHLSVEQLGAQWLENNAGSWGSSEQTLILLKRGMKAPDTGNPRYNKLWWTIGPQFSSDVYGTLDPGHAQCFGGNGSPVDSCQWLCGRHRWRGVCVRNDQLGFCRNRSQGHRPQGRKVDIAAISLSPMSGHGHLHGGGWQATREIFDAVNERWGIEYPATNNAVVNGGIVATSVWFGKGDFLTTENLAFTAADFADTDCNAANAASVVAAMHGMSALPANEVAALNDRIYGPTMGSLNLTPPVDESIVALAKRTAAIGEKILLDHGAKLQGDNLVIPTQQPITQKPELFKLSDFTKWWNPDWTLERAGFGGAGGGIGGIRGDTYLDGDVLSIWPRDEVRGALLRRTVELSDNPSLDLRCGCGCRLALGI